MKKVLEISQVAGRSVGEKTAKKYPIVRRKQHNTGKDFFHRLPCGTDSLSPQQGLMCLDCSRSTAEGKLLP